MDLLPRYIQGKELIDKEIFTYEELYEAVIKEELRAVTGDGWKVFPTEYKILDHDKVEEIEKIVDSLYNDKDILEAALKAIEYEFGNESDNLISNKEEFIKYIISCVVTIFIEDRVDEFLKEHNEKIYRFLYGMESKLNIYGSHKAYQEEFISFKYLRSDVEAFLKKLSTSKKDDELAHKTKTSYKKMIKGLLAKEKINPKDTDATGKVAQLLERQGETLDIKTIRKILKEL